MPAKKGVYHKYRVHGKAYDNERIAEKTLNRMKMHQPVGGSGTTAARAICVKQKVKCAGAPSVCQPFSPNQENDKDHREYNKENFADGVPCFRGVVCIFFVVFFMADNPYSFSVTGKRA